MKVCTSNDGRYFLKKIENPKKYFALLVIFWIVHILIYFITENLYPQESWHIVHSKLDDMIPFVEYFIIPYVGWFVMLLVTVLYFFVKDRPSCDRFHIYLFVLDIIGYLVYIIYPTTVDFQPTEFPRDNIFTDFVKFIYSADQTSNACPSFHVAYAIAIGSVWSKSKNIRFSVKGLIWIFVALVCLATVFIKQHSTSDFFWALPMCLLAEWVAYGKSYWIPKFKKQKHI